MKCLVSFIKHLGIITMRDDAKLLEEVVVTAIGIQRQSETLTYSAQTVGGKDVNDIKNVNMINSLQDKSAGLQITPNSTGAGGSSKIQFRGRKSISGSNEVSRLFLLCNERQMSPYSTPEIQS